DVADHLAQHAAGERKPDFDVGGVQHHGRVGSQRRRIGFGLGGEQRLGIGMFGRRKNARHRARFDDLAVLHHADAVGELAHDAEVVGDEQKRHAEPLLDVLQQRDDLGLHRDVERGGRLAGDQEIGLVGERHGDHDALALAAGELMRIAVEPRLRIGNANLGQDFERAGARRGAGEPAVQQQNLADLLLDGVQRIERSHRLLKHDGDVVAANLPDVALAQLQEIAFLEDDLARGMPRRRVGQELEDRQRRDRFAGSGFPDQRQRLALGDIERDMVDRERLLPTAAAAAEGDGEIADGEEGFGHAYVFRGSNASRTASPIKINNDSISATVKKPVRPSHGACTLALPCDSNSPSDGEPGGRPKPRKSSAVKVITDDDMMNGKNVMVATMAFGNRWRNIITRLDTPSARAAWIYSKLRPRKNSARTRPTSRTQENNKRMPSSTKKPGTSTEEMISSR